MVGLGTMGSGIAQLCVQAGVPTVAIEGSDELVERGRGRIDTQLARAVENGRLEEGERERMLGLLDATTDVASLAGCDLVIEAVFEDLAVKLELFGRVEQQLADDTVLATNTSALSVTRDRRRARAAGARSSACTSSTPRPSSRSSRSSAASSPTTTRSTPPTPSRERIGKEPIACRDTPGFVVNRILIPVLNDAVRVLDEGAASAEDIDKGMRLGTNWPIGPLALIDLIGIDVHVHVCEVLWEAFREPRFAPPPRLVRMVQAGLLGRKSGRGFYRYDT